MKNEHIQRASDRSEMVRWDAGMRASMEICLAEFRDSLEFFWGYVTSETGIEEV